MFLDCNRVVSAALVSEIIGNDHTRLTMHLANASDYISRWYVLVEASELAHGQEWRTAIEKSADAVSCGVLTPLDQFILLLFVDTHGLFDVLHQFNVEHVHLF